MAFNIAFHLRLIWLQILAAIDSESRLTSFPSLCAPPSEVALLLDSNLSRRPFLGQDVDLDLLLCTWFNLEHAVLFLCKIELSNGRCFGQQQLLATSIENFISHEKQIDSLLPEILQKIYKALKSCWILNWVSIARVVACFPQESLSRPAATAADSEKPCVCARLSYLRKQSQRAAPRAWPLILSSNSSITFRNSLGRDCQMTGRDSNLDSNLNSATWPTSCKGFMASEITA